MRRMSPRETRRMMQRMGLSMSPMDVQEVVLRTKEKEIFIENPDVAILEVQGQRIFQVAGGKITEKPVEKRFTVPDEDVQLVAQQAKVSLEQARAALEQTNGDLAQAILILTQR